MVPCGLAGHRHCTVSVSRHTLHLRVVICFFSIEFVYRMFLDFFRYIYIYIYIYFFFFKVSSSLNVLLCLIGFFIFLFLFCLIMNIHIYNLFYICTGTHACMGFAPDNKLIRIRIRNNFLASCLHINYNK